MAKSSFTFAQLPEDESRFLEFVQSTGEVWARAVGDHPRDPQFQPLPLATFLHRFAQRLRKHGSMDIYLGAEAAVIQPPIWSRVTTVQGVQTRENYVDEPSAHVVRFHSGAVSSDPILAPPPDAAILVSSTIGYQSASFCGNEWVKKPPEFLKWAKKLVAWWRRHAKRSVPIFRANYSIAATEAAWMAVEQGTVKVL